MELPSPAQIKHEYPLTARAFVEEARESAQRILQRVDKRLVAIVGPCSIHDPASALEYADRLKKLLPEIEQTFFPIMRVFIEKPRTRLGWKGLLYDPHLDGSHDIVTGIRHSRALLVKIAEMGIPCATELLEPIALPFFDDLITWGLIGARTSASQPHRQMASHLPFPVGFKNDCRGKWDVAIAGILAARLPHSYIGINSRGHIAAVESKGNPFTHLVLRGSDLHSNYDAASVQTALKELQEHRLEERLLIDCSHGNSGKDPERQKIAFHAALDQARENEAIAGIMLESHLLGGKQPLSDDRASLHYGVSITDACLGWEETAELLQSRSMSSVQK